MADKEIIKEEDWIGKEVVLDTATSVVYVGRLEGFGKDFFDVRDADVHNCSEGSATKEVYLMETKRHGVRLNRKRVLVKKTDVISISLLEDIHLY